MPSKSEIFKTKPEAKRPHFQDLDFPFGQAVIEDLDEGVLYAQKNREVLLFGHKNPGHLHTKHVGDIGVNASILTDIHNSDQYVVEYIVLHLANYLKTQLGIESQAPHDHHGIFVTQDNSGNYSYSIAIGPAWQMEYHSELTESKDKKTRAIVGTVLFRPVVVARDLRKIRN